MATLDLTRGKDSDFVIYFGGRPKEVDTYTFANALVAISDAMRAINTHVNPGYAIELRLEAVAEGSFQAKVKGRPITLKDALKFAGINILLPIFTAWFYTHVVDPDDVEITVNTDEVIIEKGHDKIIVPQSAYNEARRLPRDGKIAGSVAKAIDAVESDPGVTSLGIMRDFKQKNEPPAVLIPREDFTRVRAIAERQEGRTRTVPQDAVVTIIKAIYGKSDRKWEFVWNGVKISALIKDPIFLADLKMRKYLIGTGDALDVVLSIEQVWDDEANVWLNADYTVSHVRKHIPGSPPNQELDFDDNAS
jgi:hypothetical protein